MSLLGKGRRGDRELNLEPPANFQIDSEEIISEVTKAIENKPAISTVSALSGVMYAASTDGSLDEPTRIRLAAMIYELAQNVLRANGIREERIKAFISDMYG